MPLAAGDRLGPYEVIAQIGKGGMGEVYRARDTRLAREVAIKVSVAKFSERFAGEARAIAALNHPNICTLYDVGPDYLVMELVEGPSLAERIQEGPLPPDEALRIAHQIGDALDAAHEKNIVHRDLKPANVKIKADGLVKVLDFGLAKAMEPHDSGADLTASPTLTLEATRAGMILGTAGYMSPEQARGKTVDHRSDIWAFGVVFYEMLTGRTTFEGETVSDTLAAVLRADIDWSQLPPGTPEKIRRLLKRCLDRDPKRRLRDIADAWIEMDTPEQPAGTPALRNRSLVARWLRWVSAALIAAGGIGWGLFHSPGQLPVTVVRSVYSPTNPVGAVALSADGSRLAYTEFSGSAFHIMLRNMDAVETVQVHGANPGVAPVFSPDGQWIAYLAGNVGSATFKLEKVPVSGGASITLCEVGSPNGLTWGDDGTIVFSGGRGLMRISSAGGAPQPLIPAESGKSDNTHTSPFLLPGSKALLFTVSSGAARRIALLDLVKGTYRVLVQDGTSARYIPTGHLLFARDSTVLAAPFSLRQLAVTGPEVPVIDSSSSVFSNGRADYAVSRSGVLVYVAGGAQGGKSVLAFVDRKGASQPLSDPQFWGTGRLSPDGTRVANSMGANTGNGDIWIYQIQRRTLTRLTFEGQNQHPVWTPDGRRLVFGRADKNAGLYWVPADGSGKADLLLPAEGSSIPYSWSPDGRTLVFSQAGAGKSARLWTLPVAADGTPAKPSPFHESSFSETDAQVSPDGRWLAYVSNESGAEEVYLQPFPHGGEKVRISTMGGSAPRWSRNGRELFYWGGERQSLFAVDTQTAAGFKVGIPHELFKMPVGTTWDVSPDAQFLVEQIPGINGGGRIETVANWFEELRRRVPSR